MSRAPADTTTRYRLVIVDDSPFYRLRFARMFGNAERLALVGTASNGEEGIGLIAAERPDVVLLDLTMPGIDGFGVLRWVMSKMPVPVVVCSSRRDRESIFRALELGAVDYITKPESARDGLKGIEHILIDRVESAARARVGQQRPKGAAELDGRLAKKAAKRSAEVIAIAASTGGPSAIQRLVRELPRDLLAPIVVAQHMPPGFTRMFAERLERLSHYSVVEAKDGAPLNPRRIYVAPGGMQTRLARREDGVFFAVTPRGSGDVHAPSADMLFESVAEVFGSHGLAVVLTGMGDDGSKGVRAVKDAGGYVVAETSESALIYGMPRAAVATGCADAELALEQMPAAFLALARQV